MRKRFVPLPIIPRGNAGNDDDFMDIREVRKRNIELLVREHGGPTEFGRVIEREQVQVSQWLGGKSVGHMLARHIETRLGRPVGWLDTPQWLNVREPAPLYDLGDASQAARLDPGKVVQAMQLLQRVYQLVGAEPYDLLAEPQQFCDAYAALSEDDGDGATGANVIDISVRIAERLRQRQEQVDEQSQGGPSGGADRGQVEQRAARGKASPKAR